MATGESDEDEDLPNRNNFSVRELLKKRIRTNIVTEDNKPIYTNLEQSVFERELNHFVESDHEFRKNITHAIKNKTDDDLSKIVILVKHSSLPNICQEIMIKKPVVFQRCLTHHILKISDKITEDDEEKLEPFHIWIKLLLDNYHPELVHKLPETGAKPMTLQKLVGYCTLYDESIAFTDQGKN